MQNYSIDINVDVGEGINNESQLMPYISSCNIACGGHAGDKNTMRTVVRLAKKYGVKIGAHPSFPDRENFGRKPMDISCADLHASVQNQIKDLTSIVIEEYGELSHVKLHGALYNLAAVNPKTAQVIVAVMKSILLPVKLYVPYNSVIAVEAIKNNIPVIFEAFADRNYNDDGTLVPRRIKNALIHDSDVMFEHVYNMILNQKVKTINGKEITILADTFCVHGDNPNAVRLIVDLRMRLEKAGIKVV